MQTESNKQLFTITRFFRPQSLFCLPRLHLFVKNEVKTVILWNIYDLKWLSIWKYLQIYFILVMQLFHLKFINMRSHQKYYFKFYIKCIFPKTCFTLKWWENQSNESKQVVFQMRANLFFVCVCVFVRACVHGWVGVFVRAWVGGCVRACVGGWVCSCVRAWVGVHIQYLNIYLVWYHFNKVKTFFFFFFFFYIFHLKKTEDHHGVNVCIFMLTKLCNMLTSGSIWITVVHKCGSISVSDSAQWFWCS